MNAFNRSAEHSNRLSFALHLPVQQIGWINIYRAICKHAMDFIFTALRHAFAYLKERLRWVDFLQKKKTKPQAAQPVPVHDRSGYKV